jgi:hypothetical protein
MSGSISSRSSGRSPRPCSPFTRRATGCSWGSPSSSSSVSPSPHGTPLPKFYDDAKLLLNIGEIREGERIVFDGIPWRIDSLSFFTVLKNDHLRGGRLRLPVRRLAGLHSRAVAENELWFPTEEGDWIDLPDLGHARVVSQTPNGSTSSASAVRGSPFPQSISWRRAPRISRMASA